MTDDGFGVCHRYPPTVPYNDEDPDHAGQEFTRYPTTNEEDWCGEQRQSADPKRYT